MGAWTGADIVEKNIAVSSQTETDISVTPDLINLLLAPRYITQRKSHQVHKRMRLRISLLPV